MISLQPPSGLPSGNAMVISTDVHRRLEVHALLQQRGYRVLARRTPSRLQRDCRIYRPDVVVIDASALLGQAQYPFEVRRLAGTVNVLIVNNGSAPLPEWAQRRSIALHLLEQCLPEKPARQSFSGGPSSS